MLAVALPLLFATCMYGQKNYKLTGKIISATNTPIADAVVSVQDTLNATTKADGEFTFKLRDKSGVISVWAPGYLPVRQLLNGRTEVVIMMISDNQYKHNEQVVLPFRGDNTEISDYTAATNIAKKDFLLGSAKIDRALAGQVAGLQVKRGSGMPGEGSYYFTFQYKFDKEMAKRGYITVDKGSVTVNGVSLTVCNPTDDTFQVAIIPYTYEHTNFHTFEIGSVVNIEFDIIGKYISRMIQYK